MNGAAHDSAHRWLDRALAARTPAASGAGEPTDDDLTALLERYVPAATMPKVRKIVRSLLGGRPPVEAAPTEALALIDELLADIAPLGNTTPTRVEQVKAWHDRRRALLTGGEQ